MTQLLNFQPSDFIKIYIGQLPLALEEQYIRQVFSQFAEIVELRLIKGDSQRGKFDLFCYAFITIRGTEASANEVISQISKQNPSWKMNIKNEDRSRMKGHQQQQQPVNLPYQMQNNMYPPRQNYQTYAQQPQTNTSEKIVGEKPCDIMVRELWLGGIPENMDKMFFHQMMSHFGTIEQIEMFPKFCFAKFKLAQEATIAFERADQIHQMLGNPMGLRIFFSDPSRRAMIVSNYYEFDRQSNFSPILFLGFPPITSATVQMNHIRSIVEKYGKITNQYMRKNTNTQNRSYFLFTYDNIKAAMKAKIQLSKRRDLLGDKRAEVTLLLDKQAILKGRDLSHTEKNFQGNIQTMSKRTQMTGQVNQMQMGYPPMYMNQMYYPPPPAFYPQTQPPLYYDMNYQPHFQPQQAEQGQVTPHLEEGGNIHEFLENVLAKKEGENSNEKKPVKSSEGGNEEDILSKLLGEEVKTEKQPEKEEFHHRQDQEPSWSGFLTWKGLKRVGVDGYSTTVEPEDYAINVVSLIQFKDIVIKEKSTMILEPSNKIFATVFKEYVKILGDKVGVAMNSQYLMYIMSRTKESDEIEPINDNELLVVLEKASFLTQIKDKLIKCQQML